jgi:DNA invertase Pin-like site-specific DNA recombinase
MLGYRRDGQSVAAQVAALSAVGAGKVFREVANGAKTDRAQRRRLLDQLGVGDVLMVTRLDRLARSTRDDTYGFGCGASRRTSAAGLSSRRPS